MIVKYKLAGSAVLLLFLGALFSVPIVTVGFSVHGYDLALLVGPAVIVLVFLGPLSFLVAGSLAADAELGLIVILGALIFVLWLKAVARESGYALPYLLVTGWALMGAYFCVSLFFAHAA